MLCCTLSRLRLAGRHPQLLPKVAGTFGHHQRELGPEQICAAEPTLRLFERLAVFNQNRTLRFG